MKLLTPGILVMLFTLHPFGQGRPSLVFPTAITVQDATTSDPDASVMVYSSPDDVTVIWLLAPVGPDAS